jgi:hypothetical protein
MAIRYSSSSGVPFGTSSDRPSSPQIGQTFYNGTLGVQEIYTSSGWLPATGANDFNVTLNGSVTTATFTKEYFSGAYTIASALLDNTYDIYVYDTSGNQVGYTKSPSLNATGNFNKIVVIGGSAGDLLSFSYKTTFTATNTTAQTTAGAFITSVTPTALNSIDDTATVTGGNFASNVAVYFVGSDNTERPAKSIVRTSNSQLIITRPDNFPTTLGTYKLVVENPGITRPTGSSLHILNNAVTAGTTPNWTTGTTLTEVGNGLPYSVTLLATDTEGTDIDYSIVSGTLPSGITLNGETGVLSGTYTGSDFNTTNLVIRAVDTGGNTVDRTFTIFKSTPVWVTSSLATFESNQAYSRQLSVTSDTSVTYTLNSGTLPSGFSLSSSGLISGTTTSTATSTITIRATDTAGNYSDQTFSLAPNPIAAASGLILWFDGSDPNNNGNPPSSTTTITTWSGKALGINASHYDGTKEFVPNVQNGKGAIKFNPNSSFRINDLNMTGGSVTTFLVAKKTAAGSMGIMDWNGAGDYINWYCNGDSLRWEAGDTPVAVTDTNSFLNTTIVAVGRQGSSGHKFQTSTGFSSSQAGQTIPNYTRYMAIGEYSGYFNGYIMELVICRSWLSDADVNTIYNSLKTKWGVA